MHNIC